MHIFRMIDMLSPGEGVIIDMEYKLVNNLVEVIDLTIRNIINNIVGDPVESADPLYEIAFAANFINLLEEEHNK